MRRQYEEAFARCIGVPHAYAFWKGRAALYAILRALGIGRGDDVVLPGFTCVVVPNSIRFAGATPVFADIDPASYNVTAETMERVLTARTRALIVQHTYGIPVEMAPVLELARRRGLLVIEDCAHAIGSTYRGRPVGTFGAAAFFSSQWSKPYTTGVGGMAVTTDHEVAEKLTVVQDGFSVPTPAHTARLALQYQLYSRVFSSRSYWTAMGLLQRLSRWNLFVGSSSHGEIDGERPADLTWKMSTFQAKAGLRSISALPDTTARRRVLSRFYTEALPRSGWDTVSELPHTSTNLLRYPVRVANKVELLERARLARVELGSWFESVLHPVQAGLDRFSYRQGQCPIAERTAGEVINLPVHPRVSIEDAERIIAFLLRVGRRSDARSYAGG
ncbi:DegT/DnrJ/EryC1/StrS family aminotransferase [Candidatus Nitrospira bockiana]